MLRFLVSRGLALSVFIPLLTTSAAEVADAPAQARAFIEEQVKAGKIDKANPAWRVGLPKYPLLKFDPAKTYTWTLNTNKGKMKLKFLPEAAPNHVSSAIYLSDRIFTRQFTLTVKIQRVWCVVFLIRAVFLPVENIVC